LLTRLGSPNVYFRDIAQRLLAERGDPKTRELLKAMVLEEAVLDANVPAKARPRALWTLIASGPLEPSFHQQLLNHESSQYRAWAVRAAGNQGKVSDEIRELVVKS